MLDRIHQEPNPNGTSKFSSIWLKG